jgi:transcriptional regulator with XRE-family HTH domain
MDYRIIPIWKGEGGKVKRVRLAQRRKIVGLSQEKLAEVLRVDVSTVRRWEYGEREPQPWHRPKLAKALKISVEEVAGLLGDADTTLLDALSIPIPVEVLWPELRDGRPPAAAHLQPWAAERTLKELSIFVRSDMLTRRETLAHAVKALSGPALVAPIAGWIATSPDHIEPRNHGTHRIGTSEVEVIERSTRFFAATDAELGGTLSREAAVGQLKYAVDLARYASYSEATGNRLLTVIAELSGLVGWLCHDSGMPGPAQRYFTYGLQAARESADPRALPLVVSILSDMAQQMRWLDRPDAALRMHDLAARQLPTDQRRYNVLRAILTGNRIVDGLSRLGRSHLAEARSALSMSFDLYSQADADDRAAAPTMWHRAGIMDEARLSSNAGSAYLVMAGEDKRLTAEAEKFILLNLANLGQGQGRNKAFGQIELARIRFLAGEPEQASDDGNRAIEAAERTSSAMIRTRLRVLLTDSEAYAGVPRVGEFRDRLRGVIARN